MCVVTRNVTIEPEMTLKHLFARHDIDLGQFDYVATLPLGEDKTGRMKRLRELYAINPLRAYACGDECSDYLAAISAGVCPFVVACGFEDRERLVESFGMPREVISCSPAEFSDRLLHALGMIG